MKRITFFAVAMDEERRDEEGDAAAVDNDTKRTLL
jgi:hypothetical protein